MPSGSGGGRPRQGRSRDGSPQVSPHAFEEVRFAGNDAPELDDDDPALAARAREAAASRASLLPEGTPILVEPKDLDNWKRIVCRVTALDPTGAEYDVGERLVQVGLAVPA